jgi:hypothetical protein
VRSGSLNSSGIHILVCGSLVPAVLAPVTNARQKLKT